MNHQSYTRDTVAEMRRTVATTIRALNSWVVLRLSLIYTSQPWPKSVPVELFDVFNGMN